MSVAGADNTNNIDLNNIFTIKDTTLYFLVVTLSVRDYQKPIKNFLAKNLKDQFKRDSFSHLFKHSVESGFPVLDTNDYETIEKG